MKLHIGCGEILLDGWTNCDSRNLPGVVVCDAHNLPFDENSVDEIYACHILEHFGFGVCTPSFVDVLKEWHRVLKPGGALRVSVPDLVNVAAIMRKCSSVNDWWNATRLLYGGSEYAGNRHFVGFSRVSLEYWLDAVGFIRHSAFAPFVQDTSRFEMLEIPVSLNIQTEKPL